ncbi:PAZ domain-containing protein [Caenorhabditis elegans]|uniref:PAZ domain-containing protein n=1 Tax=Caenorhabditis elegans TaxID=6239 RepID=Q19598_CAEEL|nr:PAZ domain-containing protein [Caenorhabditis elegans]CCD69734.2 PAZ domain-containing protein [Caenorhabditis elegans]
MGDVRVETRYNNRTIEGVLVLSNNNAQLVFGPTRLQVSVERYFFWKYRIRLTRPNWPLVFLRGNSSNQFPIELIELI